MNQTLITAALSIIILSITTYINIKTKFAKDEKEAFKYVSNLVSNIALLLFVAWCSYTLYGELTSGSQITRMSIFIIVINTLAIYQLTVINIQFFLVFKLFDKINNAFGKQLSNFDRLLNLVEKLSCVKKSLPDEKLAIRDTDNALE